MASPRPAASKKAQQPVRRVDLAGWQHSKPGKVVRLSSYDPGAKPFSAGDKAADKAAADALAMEIDRLQDMLFADRRFKVLVVLQGMDGSGKDGTIRGVFGRVSPLGVRTRSWRAPSEEERAHDFLWRIHHRVPAGGRSEERRVAREYRVRRRLK